MKQIAEKDALYIRSLRQWHQWLQNNHTQQTGVWVLHDTKEARTMTYEQMRDEALCFGWIDSAVRRSKIPNTSLIYMSPRKPKSNWSKVNKTVVARLMKEKRMQPSGMAMVKLAKRTGTWTALDDVEKGVVPKDLAAALKKAGPKAAAYFNAFPPSVKRGILEWIQSAKKPETRADRITKTATLAAKNQRANQYEKK